MRTLGRPRRRWEDNIKIEIGLEGVDWIYLAQNLDRGGSCLHGNEPSSSIKGWKFLAQLSSRRALLHGITFQISCNIFFHTSLVTELKEPFTFSFHDLGTNFTCSIPHIVLLTFIRAHFSKQAFNQKSLHTEESYENSSLRPFSH
jgi:hypothetical protein